MQSFCQRLAGARLFEPLMIALIVFNGVLIGLETSRDVMASHGALLHVLNDVILGLFVLEALVKIGAVAPRWRLYFGDGWNLFDFSIVVVSLIPATGEFALVARLVRVLRVLRLVSAMPQLRLIVATLVRSIPGMGHVIGFLGLIFYIYAVMGYPRGHAPRAFHLVSALPLASARREPLGLRARLRHFLAHVLDRRRLPGLHASVAHHSVPRLPRDLAARRVVPLPGRHGPGRAHAQRRTYRRRALTREAQRMIAVIFEVEPAEGRGEEYLTLAAGLRAELENIDGFISIERFQSLTTPGKLLSLSFWRDEAAVAAWRNRSEHRRAQTQGREGVFRNYRLRVASVMRDYGLDRRAEAPPDSRAVHDR